MSQPIDPRPAYRTAQNWVASLIDGVEKDQLELPTPCSEWTVRTLLGHLVAGVERVGVSGSGGDPFSVPAFVTDVPEDEWAARFKQAVESLWTIWDDPTLLDTSIVNPWGPMPGRISLLSYTFELLAHGWDLATATGQNAEAPADVAALALASARQAVPAEGRQGPVPFDPPVEAPADSGPTRQLASWLGRV